MAEIITLDGPASSGKSSVGFAFSQLIGYKFIDSGAIYRAGCLKILKEGIDLTNEAALVHVFNSLDLGIEPDLQKDRILLEGHDVTESLHDPEITKIVSAISAIPNVREAAKKLQRQIAQLQNTVMSGRAVGSEVFPDANLKFFLTARPEIRAKRRFEQLSKKDPETSFVNVYTDMVQRDERDSTRDAAPMIIPDDAIVIDNSDKTITQTVQEMLGYFQKI